MGWLVGLVFVVQAAVMLVDELHYHHQRGLPRWERIGHPLDTASVLACFALVLLRPFEAATVRIYAALALFSSLFVTKDEWVHARLCSAGERRLHTLLFALHPLALACVGWLWPRIHPRVGAPDARLTVIFGTQFALALVFFIYQILYWNIYDSRRNYHSFRPMRNQ